nr:MAG TPA: hypothetical protein [Caudoviricetes sp.]
MNHYSNLQHQQPLIYFLLEEYQRFQYPNAQDVHLQ